MVVAYYVIRLAGRTDHILTKIRLLSLEDQYLRVFHLEDWRDVSEDEEMLEKRFDQLFPSYFKGENSLGKYSVPFVLLTVTTIVFAVAVYGALIASPSIPETLRGVTLPFAVAGSLLYVYPLFGQRYAAASLSPLALYDLVRRLWLSVVIGIVAASVMAEEIRSLAAFLGAYVPLATLDLLEKRMFGEQERQQSPRKASLLGIVGGDDQVLVQLENIGVRSTLQLAYDNPLRLFVETGLDIDVCTDLVDQANLHLYVPDKEGRQTLCRYGVRSAVDLMTQLARAAGRNCRRDGPR
jgi:hypothetical protein